MQNRYRLNEENESSKNLKESSFKRNIQYHTKMLIDVAKFYYVK